MKKILVTGAEGFIGSHLVEMLVKKKYDVTALVLYNFQNNNGWLEKLDEKIKKKIKIKLGDIRDYHLIKSLSKGCDSVINLAALIGIPYSYEASKSYIETNIIGTHNILNAARENFVKKIIHTSTSEVYGVDPSNNFAKSTKKPLNELSSQFAQSPYSATKIAADQLCFAYHASFGLPVTIIRPFNAYGPRQSSRAIIPTIITQVLNGNRKIKIGNLKTMRNFNYVADIVEGFIKALETKKNIKGKVYNLGDTFQVSIKELILLISQLLSVKLKIVTEKKRFRPEKSEVMSLLCDSSKAKKELNWKPNFKNLNGLKLGLKKTIEWFKLNYHSYKIDEYIK